MSKNPRQEYAYSALSNNIYEFRRERKGRFVNSTEISNGTRMRALSGMDGAIMMTLLHLCDQVVSQQVCVWDISSLGSLS